MTGPRAQRREGEEPVCMRRGASGLHGAHVHVHDTTLLYRSFFVREREGGFSEFTCWSDRATDGLGQRGRGPSPPLSLTLLCGEPPPAGRATAELSWPPPGRRRREAACCSSTLPPSTAAAARREYVRACAADDDGGLSSYAALVHISLPPPSSDAGLCRPSIMLGCRALHSSNT